MGCYAYHSAIATIVLYFRCLRCAWIDSDSGFDGGWLDCLEIDCRALQSAWVRV